MALVALLMALALAAHPQAALADDASAGAAGAAGTGPSVLVVDAGLGDWDLFVLHWLGSEPTQIADSDGLLLMTAPNPVWWSEGGGSASAPATFLLGSSSGASVKSEDIVWALDQIRASGAEPKTFIMAMGATGLPVREYVQDMAQTKQSARADIVGLGFCGTPHAGYSAMSTYPELDQWAELAASIGVTAADLSPDSDYLAKLNSGIFPRVCKTISVSGSVGDLGFGLTDGAGTDSDFVLPASVSDQVVASQANASIGQTINLTGAWEPFTSAIDYPDRTVDKQLAERLSSMSCYETSPEVQSLTREFYESWFAGQKLVTHNSSVLALDLSGSMVDSIGGGETKLSAAKVAAKEYLQAMRACADLPQSAPMDVSLFGFGEATTTIADTYDASANEAIDRMQAWGETDIGLALDRAMLTLRSVPACAEKRVLLLSDGASTQGQSEEQMFAGAIAEAKAGGIVIDAVGFGDVGESNVGFLKRVTEATGGTYYYAADTYDLRVNFLKSYYSSLGLSMVDEEFDASASKAEAIGTVDRRTSALEIGVVADGKLPDVKLICNGSEVADDKYTKSEENGLLSIQCVNPQMGEYSMEFSGDMAARKHVFAVKQQGVPRGVEVSGEELDISLYLLIATGALCVLALIAAVIFTMRRKKTPGAPTGPGRPTGAGGPMGPGTVARPGAPMGPATAARPGAPTGPATAARPGAPARPGASNAPMNQASSFDKRR